jgi:hypothetical protein
MSNEAQTSGGVGFLSLLTLLFIGLKLGGIIDWSWWLVLAPTLIPIGIGVGVLIFMLILILKR